MSLLSHINIYLANYEQHNTIEIDSLKKYIKSLGVNVIFVF